MEMHVTKVLDAKGLACPMPIVRTKKVIDELASGEILEIHATDRGSKNDLVAWVNATGHELIQNTEENSVFKFWIKKQ
jgi:TusA-related sulfurtransferase